MFENSQKCCHIAFISLDSKDVEYSVRTPEAKSTRLIEKHVTLRAPTSTSNSSEEFSEETQAKNNYIGEIWVYIPYRCIIPTRRVANKALGAILQYVPTRVEKVSDHADHLIF